jgi:anti-sigma factor RsiW
MMSCSKARRWFGAYWDDEITQAEREWLEAHFAACARCRTEYEAFARTLESLESLPRHEAAPDFVERALARARRAAPESDRIRMPRPTWAPVAAAAVVLVVAATLIAPWAGRGGRSTAVRRIVPEEARLLATAQPQPSVVPQTPGAAVHAPAPSQGEVAALVDSLIDHAQDVDFVLDPVRVSRDRTAGRRLQPVQGQQAVITF